MVDLEYSLMTGDVAVQGVTGIWSSLSRVVLLLII